ncbi:histone-arginine methyltransferase CARM1 [Cryptococcus neoformans A2-102-5]|nr:histone-arginine methyltransferase CARM1 [Cryptococcus neoformans var. grubii 125.91]OXG79288.1 histone-arginine methyltransferase CARM1 [Cryptococcus neoformans var. grubii D17-1]OXG92079.1 histone-arginine methyltransferase CARM1 [Cryptococcus neoformans var. grubii A2-102-5]
MSNEKAEKKVLVDGQEPIDEAPKDETKEQANDESSQVKDHDFYFNFYSSLQNQANMIGDVARTGTYRKAILGNAAVAFAGKTVLDVGAGSGILSYMSAQAGANQVIALEASSMAEKIEIMIKAANSGRTNPHLKDRIRIVRGMVENKKVQEQVLQTGKVDTIVSEPIGVMLLHERMVESFILARDLFLKPGGQLLPSAGHIFFCPFSDEGLYNETDQKAQFFNNTLFGTDFSELYDAAREEVFGKQPDKLVLQQHLYLLKLTPPPPLNTLAQPVVGMFPPTSLISTPCPPKSFDFYTCSNDDLLEFTIPIDFIVSRTSLVHGLASWFDLDFQPRPAPAEEEVNWNFPVAPNSAWQWMTQEQPLNPGPTPPPPADGLTVTLSTGPNVPRTHWQQARLLLPEPLAVNKGERLTGSIHFKVNDARSYDLFLDLQVNRPGPEWDPNPLKRTAKYALQQQCFNYSYNPDANMGTLGFNGLPA